MYLGVGVTRENQFFRGIIMGKAETIPSHKGQVDEQLMKPFGLGWTREVVKRVLTKNPTCDIYYFNPSGKKLRSLREVKAYLTDGLSPECFSFKKEIFGLNLNFETVRDANCRKKTPQKRQRSESEVETEPEPGSSGAEQPKRMKSESENLDSNLEEGNAENNMENIGGKAENNAQRKKASKASDKSLTSKRIRRSALAKAALPPREKNIFRKVMCKDVRRSRVPARKKLVRKSARKAARPKKGVTKSAKKEESKSKIKAGTTSRKSEKQVSSTSAETESKSKNVLRSREKSVPNADSETKSKRDDSDMKKNETSVQITGAQAESEDAKEVEAVEESTDLKSIVQKNIVKYRKLREKQKLKLISAQMKKSHGRVVNNSRAESFLKNKGNYIKPLQKGWRRELVYRSNCSKSGLKADVYYIHPNGKKFRSSREIMNNPDLIRGLSIDLFTFRKEAVGCGEPLEVIRSARTSHKL